VAIIEGLGVVLTNFERKRKMVISATQAGMGIGLSKTTKYIKEEFVYKKTHRGFNDITANLRNSINDHVEKWSDDRIIGTEYAGMEYAPYVEFRWEGKHAYLYPGVMDMSNTIQQSMRDAVEAAVKGATGIAQDIALESSGTGQTTIDSGSLGEAISR
jgi:hypothetical protein